MRDPVKDHHPLEEFCEVIDCPEPHERIDGIELCGDVLELDGDEMSRRVLGTFTCQRPRGHRLVHIDNSRARAAGMPAWSMVWGSE